jgi:hypothetical protein
MNDQLWQSIRYLLIGGGAFLAGRGKLEPEQVAPLVDSIMQVGGAAVALGSAAWGLYVKWKTRAVPAFVAARPDVPTVSAATGSIER